MSLSLRTRIAYGLGDFGQNMLFQVAGIYLLSYYTDVLGIEAAWAGSLFLLARLWDGLNDPLMGLLAQRSRSPWGRYRPWLIWMAIPLALSFVALFWVPVETGRLYWIAGAYIVFGMSFTAVNIPFGALTAALTADYRERGILTGYRMTLGMTGGVLASFAFLPLVQKLGGGADSYTMLALGLAGVLIICLIIAFAGVKEQAVAEQSAGRIRLQDLRAIRKNRPFWLLCIAFGAAFTGWAGFAASAPYYFRYIQGDEAGVSWVFLIVMGLSTLTIPLWTRLSARIDKRGVFLWGTLLYALAFVGTYFWQGNGLWLGYLLFAIQGLGNGAAVYTSWAMIPDTVEYGQWQTGKRLESVLYGVYGVFIKLGLGLGAAIIGYSLSWAGYAAGTPPTATVLQTIRVLFSILPLAAVGLAAWAMYLYPLSSERHAALRAEISKPKA